MSQPSILLLLAELVPSSSIPSFLAQPVPELDGKSPGEILEEGQYELLREYFHFLKQSGNSC